ncbi:hypothetical protein LTR64_007518 [Lithohypha guttulata]|uniref:uncharacterized protein n=1 Tax=Lithohypha guttulata TaxID=1690604 RepID=UPI002DE05500|nr:hypothetical protein LTR51_007028 [Lithohypha guttulata]
MANSQPNLFQFFGARPFKRAATASVDTARRSGEPVNNAESDENSGERWRDKRQRLQADLAGTTFVMKENGGVISTSKSGSRSQRSTKRLEYPMGPQILVVDHDEPLPPGALSMVVNVLRLIQEQPSWMPQLVPELRQLLAEYEALSKETPNTNPLELLGESLIRRWVPHAWDFVTSYVKQLRGLDGMLPVHEKAYGGMTACLDGFDYRVFDNHDNPHWRQSHSSLHYAMLELPDTQNDFYYFATYPRGMNESSYIPEIVVNEGVMISVNGLYEDDAFYKTLKGCGVPMCINGVHEPCIGLNRDPGFKYAHFKDVSSGCALYALHPLEKTKASSTQAIRANAQSPLVIPASAVPALPPTLPTATTVAGIVKPTKHMVTKENRQRRDKLRGLVTTGVVAKLSSRDDSGKKFVLYRGMDIRIDKFYMDRFGTALRSAKDVTAFVNLSPEKTHPHAFYEYGDNDSLAHFGLWVQVNQSVGFWIRRSETRETRKNNKNRRMASDIATMVSKDYGLLQTEEEEFQE